MNKSRLCFLIYWAVVAVVVLVLTLWMAHRAAAAISDCIDATCRITTADGSRGSGCVFEISRGQVFVLTAAHVVGNHPTVQCEFWRDGHQSQPLPGRVIARANDDRCDAAVVALPESQFGGVLPRVVPVAPRETTLRAGETITSVGCAKGVWSTAWKGHVLGYQGGDLHFTPTPADGRSGSAIFDAEGKMIVGLLRARTTDGSQGIACSLPSLYAGLSTAFTGDGAQCGPGGCGPGGYCPAPQPYLLPYRRQKEQERIEGRNAWPTQPGPPGVDLGPTNEKIDGLTERIVDLLQEIRAGRQQPAEPAAPLLPLAPPLSATPPLPAAPPVPATPPLPATPPETDDDATLKSKVREILHSLVGDRETLKERFDARVAKVQEELGEDASRREVARAYVKDLAGEKLTAATGWTIGKILAASLGLGGPVALAIAAAGFLVAKRIDAKLESGEPLLIRRVADRLGEKIDDLKDRLRDDVPEKTTSRRKAKA